MNLTEDNIKFINEFLNNELVYRETYNELQDHILSALEQYPANVTFESAFHDIINTQFKGTAGLRAIDRQYRKHGVTEMRNRYFAHIRDMFKFPAVIYMAVVSSTAFLFFKYISANTLAHIGVFVIVAGFPGIINGIRYIRTGYHYNSTKRSVADDGYRFLKYFPGVIYVVFMFLLWGMHFQATNLINSLNPGVATLVFMAYFLHAVAFFKMYKEEFKFNFVK
jgi:hypothetical protein